MALYNPAPGGKPKLPPGVTQEMIDASLAANPNASKGGYEGVGASYTGPGAAPATIAGVTQNSPIPGVDPTRIAQANDAYSRALASVNSRRGATLTSYGFKASGYDDSGNPLGLEVDPTSQFGAYQQMLNKQAQDSMAAEDASSGRGFTGGLANQGESSLRYSQGADRLTLGQGLLGSLGSLNTELLGAKQTQDDALYQARLDAARLAADQGNWTPYETTPDDPTTNAGAITVPIIKPLASPTTTVTKTPVSKATALAKTLTAKKVRANKTGATVQKGRGVISIH